MNKWLSAITARKFTIIMSTISAGISIYIAFTAFVFPMIILPSSPHSQYDIDNLKIIKSMNESSNLLEKSDENPHLAVNNVHARTKNNVSDKIDKIEHEVADIKTAQDAINRSIMQTPEKALDLPLMKKDIEETKKEYDSKIAAMQNAIDRIYDMNKWLLGAMAISVVVLSVSNFIKRPS